MAPLGNPHIRRRTPENRPPQPKTTSQNTERTPASRRGREVVGHLSAPKRTPASSRGERWPADDLESASRLSRRACVFSRLDSSTLVPYGVGLSWRSEAGQDRWPAPLLMSHQERWPASPVPSPTWGNQEWSTRRRVLRWVGNAARDSGLLTGLEKAGAAIAARAMAIGIARAFGCNSD